MTSIGHANRRPGLGIATCCLAVGLSTASSFGQSAFRGFWVDAFHSGFKSVAQIDDMVQRALAGNYNAIVAEVLAFQDSGTPWHGAYWDSAIVPKATDIIGGIDPLQYLCQQAHDQGIEVHAWLVAFRVSTHWPPNGNAILTAHPEWLMVPQADTGTIAKVGDHYTLDPGSPDVQDYLVSIVRELVTNYEIDGINWDYIRYTQSDAGYPSDTSYYYSSWQRYQRIGGNWNDFRRRTISELVRRCRAEIPIIRENPRQPIRYTADLLATGSAPASFSNSLAYQRFQDWRLWMERGWLDAGMPMNYKREHSGSEPIWYRSWIDAAIGWRYCRHMYCGQGNYLNSMANSITQLQYAYSRGVNGSMNYSYYATADNDLNGEWENDWSWYPYVSSHLFTSPATLPTMPWRDPATATEGTLWGRVINWETGNPVDDATVQVDSLPSTETDGNGYYVVTLIPATAQGTSHTVTITKTGVPSGNHPAAIILAGDVVRYDFSLGALPPEMEVDPQEIHRSIYAGGSPPEDSFTVSALASTWRGPVNYNISKDAGWLSVSPTNGTSSGEADTITITYETGSLLPGHYTAIITVSDAAAINDPQTVTVDLSLTVPGDFDGDGDVDQADFGHIQACLTGPTVPQQDPDCQDAKFDSDGDVDQSDLAMFLGCMSGPNIPGDPDCLNR